jgi:antagonist of KipI
VGNAPGAALLEMAWQGPTLRAVNNVTIALGGADLGCTVDGAPVPVGLSWFVRRGSVLRFIGAPFGRGGMRGYLAIAGGIDVPVLLGAAATALVARFGGFGGRALQVGDVIGTRTDLADAAFLAGRFWPGKLQHITSNSPAIRYVPFGGPAKAPARAQRDFQARAFELTEQSDRMGYRFRSAHGESMCSSRSELISFGVVRGAIQLLPSGNPVVLNVEHQTTGGYPLLGVVAKADFHLLAQLQPGATVRFVAITAEEARRAHSGATADLSSQARTIGSALSEELSKAFES